MIVIWSPQYFNDEHIWCAMEYKAMIDLETKRLAQLPYDERFKKLIIPVIYRGSKYYPSELSEETLYLNFEKFALYEPEMIKNKNFANDVEKLANYIFDRVSILNRLQENPFGKCNEFNLPSKADALQYIQNINSVKTSSQEFPFR